ncbi:MAG: RHS repeat-associated core domain-containing protein [Jatrophihabitans sp.]
MADPKRSSGIRNVVHVEVTPRDPQNGQPYVYRADFSDPVTTSNSKITGVSAVFTLPDGSSRTVDQATVPGLAAIAAGGNVDVPVKYTVPVPAAKGSTETDADYRTRLGRSDGASLTSSVTVTGSGNGSQVSAPAAHASSTEALPIGSIAKSGATTTDAGKTATYSIVVGNTGGAAASGLAVGDTTPDGTRADVSAAPASLAPGDSATLSAGYDVPVSQPDGPLTDTADFTWRDANHNLYGPLLSSFTSAVASAYPGATLTLTPQVAGPDVAGTDQQLTAALLDGAGNPIVGKAVSFAVTGANTASGSAVTDTQGQAAFHYSGAQDGTDAVQASLTLGATKLQSNTASVSWVTPTVNVSTTSVKGQFFTGGCGNFCHTKGDTPAFTEDFPTIDFDPPGGTVPHNITGVSTSSRPFTDITTDVNGNFNGSLVAEGNGLQAGLGSLYDFDAVFTADYVVAKAGDMTFKFFDDDGFVFGVGGGATRVSGALVNAPTSTAFRDYPVAGAYDEPTGPVGNEVTVHFPAAGVYPYELDYSECCGGELSMTMSSADGTGIPPAGNLNLTPGSLPSQPVGQPLTVTVAAMDAGGQPLANLPVVLSVGGANQQQVSGTTDLDGLAELSYTGKAAGQDRLQVGGSLSGAPSVSNIVTLDWAYSVPGSSSGSSSAPPPTVSAPTPADGALITKPTPVTANFTPPEGQSIASWSVSYRAVPGSGSTVLAQGTGAPPATLATFDPTVLANGTYQISVSATTSGGGVQNAMTSVAVTGQLKLGHYVTSYDDLNVPVAGIGMKVQRSYDSYQTDSGDFGPGWHVGLSNMSVSVNRALGAGNWSLYAAQCVFGFCNYAYTSTTSHYVTITYPNGRSEVFDFTPAGGSGAFYFLGSAAFTPRPGTGTTSTLQVDGDNSVDYGFDGTLKGDLNGPVYDPQRFVLTTKDGHAYTLDRSLGLVAERDANGNTIALDSSGVHSSTGQSISYARDASHGNRITAVTGPGGQAINYGYSSTGDLASVRYPDGVVAGYSYDGNHQLTGSTGGEGKAATKVEYDDAGRLVAVTDGAGNRTVLDNNVAGQQQIVHDPNGKLTTVYTYDDLGDVVKKDSLFDGQTKTTTFSYDGAGRVTDIRNPRGDHEQWVYDESAGVHNGDLLSHTDGSGRTTRSTGYDEHGNPATLLDGAGGVLESMTHDPATGLLLQSQLPGSPPTTRTYFANGLERTIVDPAGRTTTFGYDNTGHPVSQTDSAGHLTSYVPDAAGHLLRVADASGGATDYSYDSTGKLNGIQRPDGTALTYSYDEHGMTSAVVDGDGTTSYDRDDRGQVTKRTDRNGAVTTYIYDIHGQLNTEVRPGNDVTSYRYDSLERLVEADNSSAQVNFSYDDAGFVSAQGSCAPQPQHADCPVSDTSGALPGSRLTYSWDGAGRQLSVDGPLGTTRYHYDGVGRFDTLTDPSGQQVDQHYDAANRLSAVDLPNGIVNAASYDPSGALTGLDATLGSSTVARTDYSIDPATGQRTSSTDLTGTTSFTYQDNGALASASYPDSTGLSAETFSYDAAGNRTAWTGAAASTVSYTSTGRLASAGGVRFTYDNEGNLITRTDDSTGKTTGYHWNADHQLTGVDLPNGSTSSYRYDPLGRRVEVADGSKVTRYLYDAFTVAATYDGSNALQTGYVTTQTNASVNDASSPAAVVESRHGSATRYYLRDGSESTTTLTDEAGAVTARYRYSAFGAPAASNGTDTTFTYTGAQYDTASGLYYLRDRMYDPGTGRFLSEDAPTLRYYHPPIGRWSHSSGIDTSSTMSSAPYAYAANEPLDSSDPSGDSVLSRGGGVAKSCGRLFACVVSIALSGAQPELPDPTPHFSGPDYVQELKEAGNECAEDLDEDEKNQEKKELAEEIAAEDEAEIAVVAEGDAVAGSGEVLSGAIEVSAEIISFG